MTSTKTKFDFFPATPDRWADLEGLFGSRGACGGCWCMTWRLPRAEFNRNKGESNRRALKELVRKGPAPGVLAYAEGKAVGWCAVAPRAAYPALERSRILKPVDDKAVWSISCLFVEKKCRRQGLSAQLIAAAANFAKSQAQRLWKATPRP